MSRWISKSRYVSALQCEKLFWNQSNAANLIPPPDAGTQWIFEQGHAVGKLAQALAPGGVEVPFGRMQATVAATRKLLGLGRPVYEASFIGGDVYCRVDILRPGADGRWDLLEVKSSTSVKDVNIGDVAIQTHCLQAAGIALDRLFLVHVDRDYVRRGDIEPEKLFGVVDVTDRVRALAPRIVPDMQRFLAVLEGPEPDVPIGSHCDSPYACALKSRCWAFLPDHAVTTLHRAGARAHDWLSRGFLQVTDVPEAELSAAQRIQVAAVRSGEPQVDRVAVRRWLDRLEYPLVLLDFEAFSTAVPLLDGTSPYQAIAFQASAHVIERPGAAARHREFLATTADDPRPPLVRFLAGLPGTGSVIAWHMAYERGILDHLAAGHPEYAPALASLAGRLVDLEEPFRRFDCYHPGQRGSTSIKAVLPAFTGLGYTGDAIEEGQQAAREYLRAVHGEVESGERERILDALRSYCEKDTRAMVEILEALERFG